MSPREQKLADTLACPNCGSTEFAETHVNAALGFRCDCGLEFNVMPVLRQVYITRDPDPDGKTGRFVSKLIAKVADPEFDLFSKLLSL